MHAASHGAPTLDVSAADCGGFASCWAHAWGVLPPVPGGIGGQWGKPARAGCCAGPPHGGVWRQRGILAGECCFVFASCLSLLCFVFARSVRLTLLVLCSVFRVLVVCYLLLSVLLRVMLSWSYATSALLSATWSM